MRVLYVELQDQVTLTGQSVIRIRDVARLDGEEELVRRVYALPLRKITRTDPHALRIGLLDITGVLRSYDPDVSVSSVGARETLIRFRSAPPKEGRIRNALKVLFVSLILFFGSMGALMTFQTDAGLPALFRTVHFFLTGERAARPTLLILSYTTGVVSGILLFFNHFTGKKIREDPTPVEVEYTTYEKEIQDCMLGILKGSDDFGQRSS